MTAKNQDRKTTGSKKKKCTLLLIISAFILLEITLTIIGFDPPASDDSGSKSKHLEDFLKGASTSEKGEVDQPLDTDEPRDQFQNTSGLDPFYNISSDGTNLWDKDPGLPSWIKAYLNWHKHKRKHWKTDDFKSERWMIMQCLEYERRCGGAADRIKTIPTLLKMAYETHRILLIRWTKPATLEEFLVPPEGGVDWRVPDWLVEVMSNKTEGDRRVHGKIIMREASTNTSLLRTRYQSNTGGADFYDQQLYGDEPMFHEIFHKIWRIFFRPSEAVAAMIEKQLDEMGFVPGAYSAAHVRALYAIEQRDTATIYEWARNGINCANNLRPGAPIFFASDSLNATLFAKRYAQRKGAHLHTHAHNPNPPLHIDRCKDWQQRPSSDFYDTFVDLYLIALAKCVSFNKGGFGHWGLLIGGNVSCHINQKTKEGGRITTKCDWVDGDQDPDVTRPKTPIFLDPME